MKFNLALSLIVYCVYCWVSIAARSTSQYDIFLHRRGVRSQPVRSSISRHYSTCFGRRNRPANSVLLASATSITSLEEEEDGEEELDSDLGGDIEEASSRSRDWLGYDVDDTIKKSNWDGLSFGQKVQVGSTIAAKAAITRFGYTFVLGYFVGHIAFFPQFIFRPTEKPGRDFQEWAPLNDIKNRIVRLNKRSVEFSLRWAPIVSLSCAAFVISRLLRNKDDKWNIVPGLGVAGAVYSIKGLPYGIGKGAIGKGALIGCGLGMTIAFLVPKPEKPTEIISNKAEVVGFQSIDMGIDIDGDEDD